MDIKICTKCKKEKPEQEFRLTLKRGKMYRRADCISCEKIRSRLYNSLNRNIRNELIKIWRANNKDHVRAYSKEYEDKNKEKRYAKTARWHKENPEKARDKARRRRALKRGVAENFSIEEEKVVMEKFNCRCFNCKSKENLHIDHHYPLFFGNALTIANAVVLCGSCNCSKGHKDPSDFYTSYQLKQLLKKYKIGEERR